MSNSDIRTPEVPWRVYGVLALGLVCISSSAILVRYASEAPGGAVAALRTTFAVLMLAPLLFTRDGRAVRTLSKRDIGYILCAGLFLGLHFIAWIESLYLTSVASASVLVSTSPLFLAVLGWLFLKERISRRVAAATVLSVIGAVFIGWGDAGQGTGPAPVLGNTLALTAAALVSVYLLIGRVVRQHLSWTTYVVPLYAVVAVTTLSAAWWQGLPLLGYSPQVYILCALMALGPQLLGHGSMNYAIKYLPAALIGVLTLVEPVLASLAALVLFGEVPTFVALAGMVVVLLAVALALTRRRRTG